VSRLGFFHKLLIRILCHLLYRKSQLIVQLPGFCNPWLKDPNCVVNKINVRFCYSFSYSLLFQNMGINIFWILQTVVTVLPAIFVARNFPFAVVASFTQTFFKDRSAVALVYWHLPKGPIHLSINFLSLGLAQFWFWKFVCKTTNKNHFQSFVKPTIHTTY